MGARSAISATCTLRTSATSSRRWAAPSRVTRSSAGCSPRVAPASSLDDAGFLALVNGELRASVERVVRLTPTIVEVVVRAPAAARKFAPGQFYRLQNFESLAQRTAGTRLAMEGLALTGAWVDRERRSGVDDRARNGRFVGSLRATRAGRADRADGPDRLADRNRARRDGDTRRRRIGQRGAVLDRPGISQCRLEGALLRRLPAHDRPLQDRRYRSGRRRRRLVLRRSARIRPTAGRRTRASSATSCRGCSPTPTASSANRRSRPAAADRIIAIGSDKMMAAVGAARHTVLEAVPQALASRHRVDQFADAMHDEGNLRAMPATAARSRHRQAELSSFPASTRISPSTASTSPGSMRVCRRTRCRKSSPRNGSSTACTPRPPKPDPSALTATRASRAARVVRCRSATTR